MEKRQAAFLNKVLLLFSAAGLLFLLPACSIDYGSQLAEELSDQIPETVLYNVEHVRVKDGRVILSMEAGKAENYDQLKETRLSNLLFREYDRDGVIATEGRADSAVLNLETDDATISGNLQVYSAKDEAFILAQELYWKDEQKQLTAKEQSLVELRTSEGNSIRGSGFSADFNDRSVTFAGGARGSYLIEESAGDEEETNQ